MLNELAKKNEDLEDKITSLLDLLYGCNDCGRHGDYCECDDMEGNDVQLPAPADQDANRHLHLQWHHVYPDLAATHLRGHLHLPHHAVGVEEWIMVLVQPVCALPAYLR